MKTNVFELVERTVKDIADANREETMTKPLRDIQAEVKQRLGINIGLFTIAQILRRNGLTAKRHKWIWRHNESK